MENVTAVSNFFNFTLLFEYQHTTFKKITVQPIGLSPLNYPI